MCLSSQPRTVPSSCRSPSRFLSGDRSPSSGERRPGNRLSGDQSRWCSRSAGRRRVTSVVYMIRKRPTFAGILRIFAVREVRKLAECLASFTTVRSGPAGDEIKPGRRAKEWIAAVDRRGHRDTSSVGGTARGTSARDGLSALIGRTAPGSQSVEATSLPPWLDRPRYLLGRRNRARLADAGPDRSRPGTMGHHPI